MKRTYRLVSLRHRAIKASADTIAVSLEGTWREEHLFSLEQALERHDFLEQQIQACEARIAAMIDDLRRPADPRSDKAVRAALHRMMRVDLTAIPTIGTGTALTVAVEIGPDFSAFPSVQHFCSWLGVAPGTRISGDNALPGRAPRAVNPVGQALRMAAVGARHRARLARKDAAVAVNATARELACLIYLMVTRGQEKIEKGVQAWEKQRAERTHDRLVRKARALGYQSIRPADGDTPSVAVTDPMRAAGRPALRCRPFTLDEETCDVPKDRTRGADQCRGYHAVRCHRDQPEELGGGAQEPAG